MQTYIKNELRTIKYDYFVIQYFYVSLSCQLKKFHETPKRKILPFNG